MACYPFHSQTCYVDMVSDGVLDNYADLVPGQLKFTGPKELTQYYIKHFKMQKKKIHNKKAVVISITMGRRLLGTFLTIFFPTILLNVIGYATNFFKEFFFEVSIRYSVCVTCSIPGSDHCEPDLYVGANDDVYKHE